MALKTQRQMSGFFGIWCVSLVEVTMQNLRLIFLIEADLGIFLRYCDNEIDKLSLRTS